MFFPGEKQPENTSQDGLGLAPTAVRQIFPYKTGIEKSSFDVAIFRTCKQLQHEAEDVLYGTSSWNLMYRDWDDPVKLSYEFFQALPKRLRRLVRRVERKCYSVHYRQTISLFDWTLFMTFLARECPNLQSLKLWGPGDRFEGPGWVASCHKDAEWVQAILQIKTLRYFDIPVIAGGVIYEHPEFKDDFLPWLKYCLLEVESTDDFLPWLKGALKPKTFELNDTSLAVGNRPKPFPSSRLDAYDQIGAINDAAKSFPLLEFDAIDTPNASIFGANDQGSAADSEVKPFPLINLYVNEGLEPTAYPTNDQPLAADEGVNLFPCVKPDALKDPQPRILRENDQKSAADSRGVKPSPFFKIDAKIRDKIYRMVLLPPKKRIHPYIKPWFDLTTKNLISLFLTCKQIHQEAVRSPRNNPFHINPQFPTCRRKTTNINSAIFCQGNPLLHRSRLHLSHKQI